jgi:acyl-CoA thioester hydrolase
MNDHSPTIDTTRVETFKHWTPVTLRFSDQDSMGHVNNVSYGAFVEAGRNAYVMQYLNAEAHPGIDFVLARVTIDFRAEMHYPGTVDVGTCIKRVGGSSITIGSGLFKDGKLHATAESTNVFIDLATRKSCPVPADIREELNRQLIEAAGA